MPIVFNARLRMFLAAFTSAFASCPHLRQWNTAWLSRFSLSQYPQALQMRQRRFGMGYVLSNQSPACSAMASGSYPSPHALASLRADSTSMPRA